MRRDGPTQPQYLIRDGTTLHQNLLLLDHIDQQWVLVQAKAMPNAPRAHQHGVKQILVRRGAITQCLARVKEEGHPIRHALVTALLAEPEKLREDVAQGAAEVFLPDEVVACEKMGKLEFGGDGVVHILDEGLLVPDAQGGPDHA